jgi:hypothetical protein
MGDAMDRAELVKLIAAGTAPKINRTIFNRARDAMVRQRVPGMIPPTKSALEQHPEHVQAIGMVSIEVANLEINLGELLAALLHIDAYFGRLVYLTPQSFAGRLAILRNVVKEHINDDSEGRKHLEKLIERAERVLGKRHEYIHNTWGTSPQNPRHVVRQEITQRTHAKLVPINELKDLIEAIRELSEDVGKTTKHAFAAWPPYTWQEDRIVGDKGDED